MWTGYWLPRLALPWAVPTGLLGFCCPVVSVRVGQCSLLSPPFPSSFLVSYPGSRNFSLPHSFGSSSVLYCYYFLFIFIDVWCGSVCQDVCVEVRGQLEAIGSLLLCGSWVSNSGCQIWQEAPTLVSLPLSFPPSPSLETGPQISQASPTM